MSVVQLYAICNTLKRLTCIIIYISPLKFYRCPTHCMTLQYCHPHINVKHVSSTPAIRLESETNDVRNHKVSQGELRKARESSMLVHPPTNEGVLYYCPVQMYTHICNVNTPRRLVHWVIHTCLRPHSIRLRLTTSTVYTRFRRLRSSSNSAQVSARDRDMDATMSLRSILCWNLFILRPRG